MVRGFEAGLSHADELPAIGFGANRRSTRRGVSHHLKRSIANKTHSQQSKLNICALAMADQRNLKAVIKNADMNQEVQEEAIDVASRVRLSIITSRAGARCLPLPVRDSLIHSIGCLRL